MTQKTKTSRRSRRKTNRRGATAVEFAFVAPILFFLFFGFWEWSRVEMMRQTCTTACFEAARRGTLPSATEAQMGQVASGVLQTYMIENYSVVSELDYANNEATVNVTAPLEDNLWGGAMLFGGRSLQASYTLQLEASRD